MRARPDSDAIAGLLLPCFLLAIAGCRPAEDTRAAASPADPESLFTRITDGEPVTDGGHSRGVAWGDFDGDGQPDLVVANSVNQPELLYRNEGGARFTEFHESPVTLAGGYTEGMSWVDVDGDGDLDLFATNTRRGEEAQQNRLFRNEGDGSFAEVDAGDLTADRSSSSMACWADLNGDGHPDVFVVNRDDADDVLYLNRGDGAFREARAGPWIGNGGEGRTCAFGDPDGDGALDLYVGNYVHEGERVRNFFYRNDGEGRFSEVMQGHFVTHRGSTYGTSWADYDADGDADLFVSNVFDPNVLYQNVGDGELRPVKAGSVPADSGGASKGHAWGDYDNDGHLDLFVANGTARPDMRNFLYLNLGEGTFRRLTAGAIVADPDTSAGAAWADLDADGDLDLFVANWGGLDQDNALYRNRVSERTGRSWLVLRLEGRRSNRMGLGARVRVLATIDGRARWQTRWMISTTGYGSANEPVVHFGLGDAAEVDSLVIQWPSGLVDAYGSFEARRRLLAAEGAGTGADGLRTAPARGLQPRGFGLLQRLNTSEGTPE